MKRSIMYVVLAVIAFMDKLPPSLAEQAEKNQIFWDSKQRSPIAIFGQGFYLERCQENNPAHQKLFENIYTDPDTMKYWGAGDVRSKEESLAAVKRYATPWRYHQLTGGFVVVHQGRPVMLVGVGLFQAAGVSEFYIMADPSARGKGLATDVMKALYRWCVFLQESKLPVFINYTNGKKAPLDTVFATASEENIASIRLMLKSGFKPIKSLHRYRKGFPSYAQMFPAPSQIKGLDDGHLSMIYPTRFMKRKAGFELKVKELSK
ncbi:GNAT family N-acetyltransferase [Candidatus Bodocaedibacter vickermanii]|uniref:N-acetyltransferase n=1 Tax=Candidatus Bodocaedibacter vickermanii TaxID=2741701 RepID=A0A7L9RRU1_9PROT|nr:N-acetyltransferase [Candidatus Paracaedibacteraceae bacterium 'Lake Konstanz']